MPALRRNHRGRHAETIIVTPTYGPTTITFTNADTGVGTQTRTATLTVNPPSLQVTPTTNTSPPSFSYTLSITSGSLNYSVSNVPNWPAADAEILALAAVPCSTRRRPSNLRGGCVVRVEAWFAMAAAFERAAALQVRRDPSGAEGVICRPGS
jgi:hypothetical protein